MRPRPRIWGSRLLSSETEGLGKRGGQREGTIRTQEYLPLPKPRITAISPGPCHHRHGADCFYSRFRGLRETSARLPVTPLLLGKCLGDRLHFLTAAALPQAPLPPAHPRSTGFPWCGLRKQKTAVLPLISLK